ncbi:Uncharacterised protein [Agathobacter rectalis]|uniref:Uncharacterized protein n=1 Tax=Agathobacter rectalis TaxID=39491 RepID=A0A173VUP8_9FIRM|nr:Uncharacterised protein [Agathobacter rectalis]
MSLSLAFAMAWDFSLLSSMAVRISSLGILEAGFLVFGFVVTSLVLISFISHLQSRLVPLLPFARLGLLNELRYSRRIENPHKYKEFNYSPRIIIHCYLRKSGIPFSSCGSVFSSGLFFENHFSFHCSIERSTVC